jgi:ABC-type multidrug transport system fused ATPase/permease subunit
MDSIGAIAIAMFLFIGRNEILHGRMTMGMFGAFIILLFKLYDPVRKFAYFYNSFQQAMGASIVHLRLLRHRGRREGTAARHHVEEAFKVHPL